MIILINSLCSKLVRHVKYVYMYMGQRVYGIGEWHCRKGIRYSSLGRYPSALYDPCFHGTLTGVCLTNMVDMMVHVYTLCHRTYFDMKAINDVTVTVFEFVSKVYRELHVPWFEVIVSMTEVIPATREQDCYFQNIIHVIKTCL